MNEFFQKMRTFYALNKGIVLGGLTLLSILLIVWARLGFTFEFNRFFAVKLDHPPSVLSVVCGETQNVLSWNLFQVPPQKHTTNLVRRWVDGVEDPVLTMGFNDLTYTDTNISPGHEYQYIHKQWNDTPSNAVTCVTSATVSRHRACVNNTCTRVDDVPGQPNNDECSPVNSACGTPTPSPTLPGLSCSGNVQRILWGDPVTFTATGGDGTYAWQAGGATPKEGAGSTFTTTWFNADGSKNVIVRSGVVISTCNVFVVIPTTSPTATPTAIPTATPTAIPTATVLPYDTPTPFPLPPSPAVMSFTVNGHNASTGGADSTVISARGNEQVQINAQFASVGDDTTILNNTLVRAALPAGLTYVPGSTSVNGAPTSVDSIMAGGLVIGTLGPGQVATVTFRARVAPSTFFPVGQSEIVISVQGSADDVPSQTMQVLVIVTRSTSQVGTVPTGPGEAVVAALLVSGIMTLLYVSYTHTSVFRRREISTITETKDPMDFRS